MNISRNLIVAIAMSSIVVLGSNHELKNNSSTVVINVNAQSPASSQQALAPSEPSGDSLLKKIGDIQLQHIIMSHWQKYRIPYFFVGLTTAYGYLWYRLHQARKLLSNPESWSCWKHHIDIDMLEQRPHDDLSRDLLTDIQERYINPANPTDFIMPLSSFLPVIEKEKLALEFYMWWSTQIIAWHLQRFFPVDKHYKDIARDALRRLKFIKNLFVVWWAHYNSHTNFYKPVSAIAH